MDHVVSQATDAYNVTDKLLFTVSQKRIKPYYPIRHWIRQLATSICWVIDLGSQMIHTEYLEAYRIKGNQLGAIPRLPNFARTFFYGYCAIGGVGWLGGLL